MIPLRDYQHRAIASLRESVRSGKRAPLLVSPTGSGKTRIMSAIVDSHVAKGGTVNWFAHRRELTAQAAETLRGFGLDVAHQGLSARAPVRVLSVQGVLASGEVPECSLAILDEAHHFGNSAEEWSKIAEAHKSTLIIGATATPRRGDGTPLSPPFDDLIVVAQVSELIRDGYLCPVEVIRPSHRLKTGKIAQKPVDAYKAKTPGQRCVVFAPNVRAADEFCAEFVAAGIHAEVVTGKTPNHERDFILRSFDAGDVLVVINVMVLTEGWDSPAVSSVIIARSCGSIGMYMQIVGRGLRLAEGKTLCTVLDLTGCSHTFGAPDEDKEFSLDGEGITRKGATVLERLCRMCGTPLGDAVVCEECGRDHSLDVPEVTGEKIDKFAWMKKDSDDMRRGRLAKWIDDARARGYQKGWALGKYKGVYGEFPPREWIG